MSIGGVNMYNRRLPVIVLSVVLVMGLSFLGFSGMVASEPNSDSKIILTSRFILWDLHEKMIDDSFVIHIIYQNYSNNHTTTYSIDIDELHYNNSFQYYTTVPINLTNKEIINSIVIQVNNITVLNERTIIIMSGITGNAVIRGISEFLISLNPFEWQAKEYNIFFGVLVASLISIFISLKTVKHYRKKKGVSEVK